MLNISAEGIAFIKEFEQCQLTPHLPTPRDRPTVGWGMTHYPDGRTVTLEDPPLTQAQADEMFARVLETFQGAVQRAVQVDLDQNEFDALVSFTYNVGMRAFQGSTLLRKLNAGDYDGAAAEFPRWNKQGGQPLRGLTRRRAREQEMFLRNVHSRETPMPQVVEADAPTSPSGFTGPISGIISQVGTAATVSDTAHDVASNLGIQQYLPYATLFCVVVGLVAFGVWYYRRHMSQKEQA